PLPGSRCHDLVVLEDGWVLSCGSWGGALIDCDGVFTKSDSAFTRGLSGGHEEIDVGSSRLASRIARFRVSGPVSFLDCQLRRPARLTLPAAPTQIRRIDGRDLSLFDYRATLPFVDADAKRSRVRQHVRTPQLSKPPRSA